MQRCLELAKLGFGKVSPNPMVGAVIVHDDKIIGEGYHQKYGEAHAEVHAVNSVKDHTLLSKSTIYVSLEPCAHHGKTPPCAELIVKHKFKKVVIGCRDSYSEVSGKGIEKLKSAGIEVKLGVLEHESRELNKRFFTFHEYKRPYIILKWAQTKDGFIDKARNKEEKGIQWITSDSTQQTVHQWRSEESSILVGKNTVINDNPSLTVRKWVGKNPIRIILDSQLVISTKSMIFDKKAKTFVFNLKKEATIKNVTFIQLNTMSPISIIEKLYELNIQSVIIEGGKQTLSSFIELNHWDEARVLTGEITFQDGLIAPKINRNLISSTSNIGVDLLEIYTNK